MRLTPGIEILDIRSELANGPGITHPAVIFDENDMILVDGGLPSQSGAIEAAALSSGISFDRLNHVIITHSDMDHIGCLSSLLQNRDCEIEVLAHDKEKPYIECELPPIRLSQMEARLGQLQGESHAQMKSLYENLKANYKNLRITVNRTIHSDETLPLCGGIKIIQTPGHTPGHICLYIPASRVLFAGDALNVESGQLVRAPSFTLVDPAAYGDSIKKLMEYDIETVVCFHGGVYDDNANQRIRDIIKEMG